METEEFENGQVSYTNAFGAKKRCVDSLKDDVRYSFDCRCGCGSGFSGYGRDIKASRNLGQSTFPAVMNMHSHVLPLVSNPPSVLTTSTPAGGIQFVSSDVLGAIARTEKPERPFVSDRYLKKAMFDLNDDEIDQDAEATDDQLETEGFRLSERKPPAIGDLVYSLATNRGPYSLIDYGKKEVTFPDGDTVTVLCGLVRTAKGDHIKIPLADLANHWGDRPTEKRKWSGFMKMIGAAIIGSAIVVGHYAVYLSL